MERYRKRDISNQKKSNGLISKTFVKKARKLSLLKVELELLIVCKVVSEIAG